MSQHKPKITTRSSKKIHQLLPPATSEKQQPTQPIKPKGGHKRSLLAQHQKSLFTMGFKNNKEAAIVSEPVEVIYSVKELLKHTAMSQILEKCPKIKELHELLCLKSLIKQKLVFSCLDKYFHGNTTSLWVSKYAPRTFNELFQADFAQKIQQWIKDFYYFRKESADNDEFGFIDDDEPQQSYSKSLQIRMKQYGWNCRALVLKGRNGVGKTSLLTAIAKSMSIRCFEYASDVDQLQKMKQLVQGSQSQVVTNIQNKKKQVQNNKLIKQNSSITKFLPRPKQGLQTKQPKRMQIFRNFTEYFPPCDKSEKQNAQDGYFKCLFDSINKSPIPYVLTSDELQFTFRQKNLNQKFAKFDEIEFIENTVQDLTYLYWIIYQIESNLVLDTSKKIKKQELFSQLNSQFQALKFFCIDNTNQIRQLVVNSNKKPLYIAKYLQFKALNAYKSSPKPSISCQQEEQMKRNEFIEECIQEVGQEVVENITSQDLVNNIEWSLYNRNYEELNPLEQTAAEEIEKVDKSEEHCCKIEEQISIKKPNLREIRQKLDLEVIKDKKIFNNEYFNFENEFSKQDDPFMNIPIQTHIKAKKKILSNIKNKLNSKNQRISKFNLTQKQLYYLPLIFASRRTSRTLRKYSKQTMQQNLSKVMNFREIAYMQKFGKFIFPS